LGSDRVEVLKPKCVSEMMTEPMPLLPTLPKRIMTAIIYKYYAPGLMKKSLGGARSKRQK